MVYVWGSMFTVPDLVGLGKNRDSEFKKKISQVTLMRIEG